MLCFRKSAVFESDIDTLSSDIELLIPTGIMVNLFAIKEMLAAIKMIGIYMLKAAQCWPQLSLHYQMKLNEAERLFLEKLGSLANSFNTSGAQFSMGKPNFLQICEAYKTAKREMSRIGLCGSHRLRFNLIHFDMMVTFAGNNYHNNAISQPLSNLQPRKGMGYY
ncbi:hypothetical protein Ciccas_011723 [Cichlidogyrus casuarinus]|uniref:Uncharacterized protein n=1 Tax=Cichlidogyrus casuarinus TaxID=1844966 RepID=A0ABD2PSL9_9PLAT